MEIIIIALILLVVIAISISKTGKSTHEVAEIIKNERAENELKSSYEWLSIKSRIYSWGYTDTEVEIAYSLWKKDIWFLFCEYAEAHYFFESETPETRRNILHMYMKIIKSDETYDSWEMDSQRSQTIKDPETMKIAHKIHFNLTDYESDLYQKYPVVASMEEYCEAIQS